MRKLLISILLVSVLMGVELPAMANPQTNWAQIEQQQTAIPISIGNNNNALFGSAGTQNVYQNQHASICQGNIKVGSDNVGITNDPFSGNNNRVCKDP